MPLLDNFSTGSAGDNLTTLTGDSGHGWAVATNPSSSSFVIASPTGKARAGAATFGNHYTNSWTPAGKNYDASIKFVCQDVGGNNFFMGVGIWSDGHKIMRFMLKSNGSAYRAACEYLWNYSQASIAVGTDVTPSTGAITAGWSGTLTIEGRHPGTGKVYTVNCYLQRDSDSNWLKPDGTWQATRIACITGTYDDTTQEAGGYAIAAIGKVAISSFGFANNTSLFQIDQITGADYVPGLAAGTLSWTQSTSGASLTSTAPVNGTPAYTRRLYSHNVAVADIAAVGTLEETYVGAGSYSYSLVSLIAGVPKYFQEKITDSLGATVLTNWVGVTLLEATLRLGWIGDSNFASYGGPNLIAAVDAYLKTFRGPRSVLASINRGVSGSTATSWTPGHGSGNMTNALAAFSGQGIEWVIICLGTNWDGSIGTYSTNMDSVIGAVLGAGYKVMLLEPPYSGEPTIEVNQPAIQAALKAKDNGSTIRFLNSRYHDNVMASTASGQTAMLYSDKIHLDSTQSSKLAPGIGNAIDEILYPSAGGGSGSRGRML